MSVTPSDDDEATVQARGEPVAPAAPVDDESTQLLPKSLRAPADVAAVAFVAQGNDVDPEATNIKPSFPAAADVEATSVDRPPRASKSAPIPSTQRTSLPRRLVRRFTSELKIPDVRSRPGFLLLSAVAILALGLLFAVFQLATWMLSSHDNGEAVSSGQQAPEERSVLDRLIHW